MALTDVFLGVGQDGFTQLMREISMGKLKTYQLYDRIKTRTHLTKLSSETLTKAAPRLWGRISENDEDLALDLSQSVLVCHLDMIVAVLNFLGVPHEDGFFAKDLDPKPFLTEGWQARVHEKFKGVYPDSLLHFYTSHLAWEFKL